MRTYSRWRNICIRAGSFDGSWRKHTVNTSTSLPSFGSAWPAIVGTLSQPLRQTIDGSLGIEKELGKARFAITGAVERDLYGDAKLSSGGTVSQKDRDSTLYTATLRGGYEISPAITPFAELEVGRRVYDLRFDSTADHYERSANRLGARAGLALDLGEKLNGEALRVLLMATPRSGIFAAEIAATPASS